MWIPVTIGFAVFFAIVVAGLGLALKRNPLAFFIKEITFFDADDISAMTLGVHKSLMQALDSVGISAQLLRRKEHFAGGRRDRLI